MGNVGHPSVAVRSPAWRGISGLPALDGIAPGPLSLQLNFLLGEEHELLDEEVAGRVIGVDAAANGQHAHVALRWAYFEHVGEQAFIEVLEHPSPVRARAALLRAAGGVVGVGAHDSPAMISSFTIAVVKLLPDPLLFMDCWRA